MVREDKKKNDQKRSTKLQRPGMIKKKNSQKSTKASNKIWSGKITRKMAKRYRKSYNGPGR